MFCAGADQPHSWTYVGDVAWTVAAVADGRPVVGPGLARADEPTVDRTRGVRVDRGRGGCPDAAGRHAVRRDDPRRRRGGAADPGARPAAVPVPPSVRHRRVRDHRDLRDRAHAVGRVPCRDPRHLPVRWTCRLGNPCTTSEGRRNAFECAGVSHPSHSLRVLPLDPDGPRPGRRQGRKPRCGYNTSPCSSSRPSTTASSRGAKACAARDPPMPAIDRCTANGLLVRVAPHVFRVRGAPPGELMAMRAAAAGALGLLSHSTSLRCFRTGVRAAASPLHVMVEGPGRRPLSVGSRSPTIVTRSYVVAVHRSQCLDGPIVHVDGIPSVDVARRAG